MFTLQHQMVSNQAVFHQNQKLALFSKNMHSTKKLGKFINCYYHLAKLILNICIEVLY